MYKNFKIKTSGILLVFIFLASVLLINNSVFASTGEDSLEFVNMKINGNSNTIEELFEDDMVLTTSINTNLNGNDLKFGGSFMMYNGGTGNFEDDMMSSINMNYIYPLAIFEFNLEDLAATNTQGLNTYFAEIDFSEPLEYGLSNFVIGGGQNSIYNDNNLVDHIQEILDELDESYSQENGYQLVLVLAAGLESSNSTSYRSSPIYISYNSTFNENSDPEVLPETNYYISDLKQICGTHLMMYPSPVTYNKFEYNLSSSSNYPFEFTFQSNILSQNVGFKLVLDDGHHQTVLYTQEDDYIKTAQPITLSTASGITSDPIAYNYKYKFNLTDDIFTSIDDYKLVSGDYDLYLTVYPKISSENTITPREDIIIDFRYTNQFNPVDPVSNYTSYKPKDIFLDIDLDLGDVRYIDDHYYVGLGDESLSLEVGYTVDNVKGGNENGILQLASAVFLNYKNDSAVFYPVLKDKSCDSEECTYTYNVEIYKPTVNHAIYDLEYRVYSARSITETIKLFTYPVTYKTSNNFFTTRSYASERTKIEFKNVIYEYLNVPNDHIINFYSNGDSKIVKYKVQSEVDNYKESAENQATPSHQSLEQPQPASITSMTPLSCHENSRASLKLNWQKLGNSDDTEYRFKLYNNQGKSLYLVTNNYPSYKVNQEVILNDSVETINASRISNCSDSYWGEIVSIKSGQMTASKRMKMIFSDNSDVNLIAVKPIQNSISESQVYSKKNRIFGQDGYINKLDNYLKQEEISSKYIEYISLEENVDSDLDTYTVKVNEPKKFLGLFNIGYKEYTKKIYVPKSN